ncbi:uncharacterized protein LOC133332805 [Musca vetustissima]|uniref:uncharacterized protein LOC133332805 n=1 Tax=Musca vetustissima TaxID=27455 RepID=UPI002AB7E6F2|nr:uncharacterized protein LOC133332805 [Musca vetustissima]
MRALIVLCLVAAACAQYNYGAGVSSSPSYTASGNYGAGSSVTPSFAPQATTLEKEFYTFTANDADFNDPAASNQYNAVAKKGLRVIFIKGPENKGLEDAALALAKQAAEQRTAIYVLNKQADIAGLSDKFNAINNNVNHKPEVHFVKYRTPEDAANAQRAIQSQYDSLVGTSQHFNGGVAPALNFASQASRGSFAAGSAPSSQYLAPAASGIPSESYLPSSILRRLRHK